VEEGHLVAGCAVAFPQAWRFFGRRPGVNNGWGKCEVDLVGLESAMAGAVVEATRGRGRRGGGFGGHLGVVRCEVC